ncbi:cation:proton antiporter domain-containing protein [Robiginitomaculum antarcticum]|uniref:cation:proton antiporter domain-containing protein n=1 Tax=Robiginitomaculum antarcticum TaxID=437507 RepID=UPI00037C2A83|nr:cation:proton antiporter [Robiginitomaculum antarcticum]
MGHEEHAVFIKDALVFLVAAGLIVPFLRSLKIPEVMGFILTGIALGVSGIAVFSDTLPFLDYITITNPEAIAPFAELGILFLLFLLGLELSVEKLWALRRIVFGVGLTQVALSTLCIAGLALAFGFAAPVAVLIGLALALSSTAIVMQLLTESREITIPIGRTSLGVLLLQDVLVAPILIFAGFIGIHSNATLASELFSALIQGVIAITVIIFLGRFAMRRVFHKAAAGGRGYLMAVTLLTVIGAAVISANAGLSVALGAFLAGLLLGETEFKHQVEVDLEPFKGLLLGLFFMTVGLSLDLNVVVQNWPLILGGVTALIVIKAIIIWVSVTVFLKDKKLSIEAAFLLAPAGEFAFVVMAAGLASGAVSSQTATLIAAIAALTMLLIPGAWRLGKWASEKTQSETPAHTLSDEMSNLQDHIIIAGFGRVGCAIARILQEKQAIIVALDTNPKTVERENAHGWAVYLGDGSREEVLIKAGLHNASMLIVTVDDAVSAERMVQACHKLKPEIPIFSRAQDVDHAKRLYKAGAKFVVPDAIEAGLQMSSRALEEIGYDGQTVRSLIASERDTEYRKASDIS